MKKYWYQQHIGACPVCGKDKSFRVRIYGKKPKSAKLRYIYLSDFQTYDHCLEREAIS
jgi:hypothetical protein